jgi:hypothetical protein
MNAKVGSFEKAPDIWSFVNHYFGYCLPYPNVEFVLVKHRDFTNLISKSTHREQCNVYEKQLDRKLLKYADANLWDIKRQIKIYGIETVPESMREIDYAILMVRHAILDPIRKMTVKSLGLTMKDYYHWHILHEFIHILEHETGKQLLVESLQDAKMFLTYLGYDVSKFRVFKGGD